MGLSPELRPRYRLVVRADGVVQALVAADDYRRASSLPQAAGTTSTTASGVAFTPAGSIAAANVQLALEELETEKAALASPTFTGTVAAPHVTISADNDGTAPQVVGIYYGTGDPPAGFTDTPDGTLYIKHEA
jgi:hypothetical protein